jgi:prepilin-type N-terminal cleavage/methylation domain-containing protein
MKKHQGFTLIELLVVITILGILSVVVISAINPIEQINRARDVATLNVMSELEQACNRRLSRDQSPIFPEEIFGIVVNQDPAQTLIDELEQHGELKQSFASANQERLSQIYLTSNPWLTQRALCFQPKSKAFQADSQTQFNQEGFYVDCGQRDCYYCLLTKIFTQPSEPAEAAIPEGTPAPTQAADEQCQDFDPEYPNYPWTCNHSDKWEQYGCSHYCVGDRGCDDYCPEGQRHLTKNYSGTGDDFESCLFKREETQEHYCVPDPYARCDIMDYRSSPSDFVWGCSDPRRPIMWQQEQEE